MDAVTAVPAPVNEPVMSYAPGSPEREELSVRLAAMAAEGKRGVNRVEAVLVRGAGRPGTWRFDLSNQPAMKPGSLRVVAGTVALITNDAVVFWLQGKPGERIVFAFELE